MNILIGNDYQILEDTLNFILFKKTKSNPDHHFSNGLSKENWKIEGYYGTVDSLINQLMKCNIEQSDKALLNQLSINIKKLKEEFTLKLEPIFNDSFSKIKIGTDYQIRKDAFNLVLSKRKESDPDHHFSKGVPKESWKPAGYFGKVEHLVNSLIEQSIMDLDVNSIEQLMKKVETLMERLTVEMSFEPVDDMEDDVLEEVL